MDNDDADSRRRAAMDRYKMIRRMTWRDCALPRREALPVEDDEGLFRDAAEAGGRVSDVARAVCDALAQHVGVEGAEDMAFDDRLAFVPGPGDILPHANFVGAAFLPVAFDPRYGLPYLLLGKTYRQWSLIGGHCRSGERPEETASREFWEETMGWVASDHMETLPLPSHAELHQLLRARNYLFHVASTDDAGRSYVIFVRQVPFDASASRRFSEARKEASAQHVAYGRMVQEARRRTRFHPPSPSSPRSASSSSSPPSPDGADRSWVRAAAAEETAIDHSKIRHVETSEGKVPHKFLELRGVRWFSFPQIQREIAAIGSDGGDLSKGKQREWTLDVTCVSMLARCVEELKLALATPCR